MLISSGTVIVIVIVAVSAAVVFTIGAVIGVYLWKQRMIQKKRKGNIWFTYKVWHSDSIINKFKVNLLILRIFPGSGDTEKYVKTLNNSSLNFKYSTLEKATRCFDEANKLGQGGFGTVYKVKSNEIMSSTLKLTISMSETRM